MLTVREVSDTLIAWAASCNRQEQLELVDECIQTFLIDRFPGSMEKAHEVTRVMIALQNKAATFTL